SALRPQLAISQTIRRGPSTDLKVLLLADSVVMPKSSLTLLSKREAQCWSSKPGAGSAITTPPDSTKPWMFLTSEGESATEKGRIRTLYLPEFKLPCSTCSDDT